MNWTKKKKDNKLLMNDPTYQKGYLESKQSGPMDQALRIQNAVKAISPTWKTHHKKIQMRIKGRYFTIAAAISKSLPQINIYTLYYGLM